MKNHIAFKFAAVFLAALSLVCALTGGLGFLTLTATGVYEAGFQEVYAQEMSRIRTDFSVFLVQQYAARELGGCPGDMVRDYYGNMENWFYQEQGAYRYRILDATGVEVESGSMGTLTEQAEPLVFDTGSIPYIHVLALRTVPGVNPTITAPADLEVFEAPHPDATVIGYYQSGADVVVLEYLEADGIRWVLTDLGFVLEEALLTVTCAADSEDAFPAATEDAFTEESTNESIPGETTEATLPQETEDTASQEETVPQSTAPAETMPEETVPEETAAATTPTEADKADAAPAPEPTEAEETIPEETTAVTEPGKADDVFADAASENQRSLPDQTVPEETVPSETAPAEQIPAAGEEPPATEAEAYEDVTEATAADEFYADETLPAATETAGYSADESWGYYDYETDQHMVADILWHDAVGYTVELELGQSGVIGYWAILQLLWNVETLLLPMLAIGLMLFAICFVYLCCAAGRKPGSDVLQPSGLNRIPLDLYLVTAGSGIVAAAALGAVSAEYLVQTSLDLTCAVMAGLGFLACLLFVAFLFAFAAQIKPSGGYWWRNLLAVRCVQLLLRLCTWTISTLIRFCRWLYGVLSRKVLPLVRRLFRAGWKMLRFFWQLFSKWGRWAARLLRTAAAWLWIKFSRIYSRLPLTWQWLVTGFAMTMILYIALRSYKVGWILVGFGIFFGIILYGTSAFGTLLESTKRMSKGDLDTKVDDSLMIGSFRDFAENLNDLADVAVVAAQKQLKSERMKTELITNVSHDIKTPLTSIINYVDLLQKPHTEQEQEAYLEVLSRQSHRLKKLIDDLMEMSKASTGNMAVEITKVDAVESVNQALGEFSDKLDRARLTPVFRHPEETVCMMADGRLVWRVLSNLLGNAVKYALPGTRLYIDLMELDGKVILSLKNISREALNVDAEELLERFVRGDTARNTEGSGLGLNIAKSLTELQKGQLQILVDGDLFKVTLIFPGA